MPDQLPALTRTVDDAFTHTWYEIRAQAIDNILDANVVWAALRDRGCFVTQRGGTFIERTLRYGKKTATAVAKGDTLPMGEDDLETAGFWDWRYISSHIQRSIQDDQKNSGKFRIKRMVTSKINAAKEALEEHYETRLLTNTRTETGVPAVQTETGKEIQGLLDIVPNATVTSGTYGKIAWHQTGPVNGWWTPSLTSSTTIPSAKLLALVLPIEVNLLSNMKVLYNTVGKNKYPPNLIISSQALFEYFEEFALDMSQIILNTGSRLAKLGFEVLKFKGADMVWTDNMYGAVASAKEAMLFLNTNFVEVVYDPGLWFEMSEWKPIADQHERIAHITCALNVITSQRRRHGLLYEA